MKKNNLMTGTLVLSVGAVLAKVFSAIYRIVLTRILGGVGIGIYQLVFPFYSLCVVLATAGIPMAISKVISKNPKREKSVLKKSLIFISIVSLTITFILVMSSRGLANLQGEKDIFICYIILSPSVLVIGVNSVLRGYFQGKHNFIPSAFSNIVEQFIKLVVGLILSVSLIALGIIPAIVGAMIGIVVSEIMSLVILLTYLKKNQPHGDNTEKVFLKDMINDILPITLTNIILPIASFVDSILVVNLLNNSFPKTISVFLYGLESGAVSSLVTIPTIFSFAMSSVILPNLTSLKHNFNKNYRLNFAIKIILIITIPCIVCFTLIPNRLIEVLYSSKLNSFGVNGIFVAARLLAISSFGIVFLAINQIYSSCLQAIELRYVAIRNLTIGVVLKFILEVFFLPSKILNIYTLSVANTICYLTAMVLNHLEIKQNFNLLINLKFWSKLILSNCLMILSLVIILSFKYTVFNTILACFVAVIIYFASLWITNIFTKKDKAMIKYKI